MVFIALFARCEPKAQKFNKYPLRKVRLTKKHFKCFLIIVLLFLFSNLIYRSYSPPLPTKNHPIFYSSDYRVNLKNVLTKALSKSTKSIYIQTYDLKDKSIISLLNLKAEKGIYISIITDKKHLTYPSKKLLPSIEVHKGNCSGLMHQKVLIIDEKLSFLGSQNLTPTSLSMHGNIMVGIHDKTLSDSLIQIHKQMLKKDKNVARNLGNIALEQGTIYFHPRKNVASLEAVTNMINAAKKNIKVAMFTFTHLPLTTAIVNAHKRGIKVDVIIDKNTAYGASKKIINYLLENKVQTFVSTGVELFHYKMAIIDDQTLIMGSLNWTKAGFKKNAEFIMTYALSKKQSAYFKKLWRKMKFSSNQLDIRQAI